MKLHFLWFFRGKRREDSSASQSIVLLSSEDKNESLCAMCSNVNGNHVVCASCVRSYCQKCFDHVIDNKFVSFDNSLCNDKWRCLVCEPDNFEPSAMCRQCGEEFATEKMLQEHAQSSIECQVQRSASPYDADADVEQVDAGSDHGADFGSDSFPPKAPQAVSSSSSSSSSVAVAEVLASEAAPVARTNVKEPKAKVKQTTPTEELKFVDLMQEVNGVKHWRTVEISTDDFGHHSFSVGVAVHILLKDNRGSGTALIASIQQGKSESISVKWFYNEADFLPKHSKALGRRPRRQELFLSNHLDNLPIQSIIKTCELKYGHVSDDELEDFDSDHFFCQLSFDMNLQTGEIIFAEIEKGTKPNDLENSFRNIVKVKAMDTCYRKIKGAEIQCDESANSSHCATAKSASKSNHSKDSSCRNSNTIPMNIFNSAHAIETELRPVFESFDCKPVLAELKNITWNKALPETFFRDVGCSFHESFSASVTSSLCSFCFDFNKKEAGSYFKDAINKNFALVNVLPRSSSIVVLFSKSNELFFSNLNNLLSNQLHLSSGKHSKEEVMSLVDNSEFFLYIFLDGISTFVNKRNLTQAITEKVKNEVQDIYLAGLRLPEEKHRDDSMASTTLKVSVEYILRPAFTIVF